MRVHSPLKSINCHLKPNWLLQPNQAALVAPAAFVSLAQYLMTVWVLKGGEEEEGGGGKLGGRRRCRGVEDRAGGRLPICFIIPLTITPPFQHNTYTQRPWIRL